VAETFSIPGDPGGIESIASAWKGAAEQVESVGRRVAANGLDGSWSGIAGDAFRGSIERLQGELISIAPAFQSAGEALSLFSGELEELQVRARRQQRSIEEAEEEQRIAHARTEDATVKLEAARVAQAAAVDPVSLGTARAAVQACEGIFSAARANVDAAVGRVGELVRGLEGLKLEYEDAVRRCASGVESARHAAGTPLSAWLEAHMPALAGLAIPGIEMYWRIDQDALEAWDDADTGANFVRMADWIAENTPLSDINELDAWAVRARYSSLIEGMDDVDKVLGPVGIGIGLVTTSIVGLQDTKGLDFDGRAIAVSDMDAASVALSIPGPAMWANFITGNSLDADADAVSMMAGGVVSGFERGGFSGALRGADQELDVWDQGALDGQFGPGPKLIGHVEDAVLESQPVQDAQRWVEESAIPDAGKIASSVAHGAGDAARAVVSAPAHLARDLGSALGL
jgi:hypothetical protein